MAFMTLKEIVQRACRKLLIPVPSTVFGSTDTGVQQMIELLKDEADDSMSDHDWSGLITSWTLTSTATNYTSVSLPSDYDRFLKDTKMIRALNRVPLIGPVNSEEWIKLNLWGSTIYPGAWRIVGNSIYLYGVPVAETVRTEYISKNFILNVDGVTPQSDWTADTNTVRFDDTIFRLGLVWRWKKIKGLEYSQDYDDYQSQKEQIIAHDRGLRTVYTSTGYRNLVPDNFWPGTVTVTP